MKSKLLKVKGIQVLSKKDQNSIIGGIGGSKPDLSKCGCDCAGNVTGPKYCGLFIACPQIYTC